MIAIPNVSTSTPCPVGYCALHPLGDIPEYVKCWPEPVGGCATLALTSTLPPAQPVPTLNEWAVMVLVAALALTGARRAR